MSAVFTAREQLIASLNHGTEVIRRDVVARQIAKPVVDAVRAARNQSWREGKRPTVVCLGQKQADILESYSEAKQEFEPPVTCLRMRIVWTNDPDHVSVYEERKGCWC